jgi:protein-S-isoprenylcysteine O-methyltransferase Ste14
MNINGMELLRKHVPDLNTPRGRARIGLYLLGWFALVTFYFVISDHIPTWSIDSQIVVSALGFILLRLFFTSKKAYQEKYKELAYRNACAHYGIPGLAIIMAAVAHAAYMNGPFVPRGWWTTVFIVLGIWLLIVGVTLWIRGTFAFGMDNLALLYVYYPEEGKIVDSNIYSILRHPVYAGALRVIIALALLNGNGNSLAFILFAPLGLFGWIRLVEEKELIERFGPSYLDYRKRVPAFWPKLRDYGKFFGFLLRGK